MKIRGVYLLSRRSIARMVAAITAALLALYRAATAEGEALVRRIHNATIALVTLDSQMVGRSVVAVVPDTLYLESKSLYLTLRRPHAAAAQRLRAVAPPRRYQARKAVSIAQAAAITGLSESTIKRLDRNPGNTNYPGRNSTAKILAAWAQLYRGGKLAARAVRDANRPRLGYGCG